MAKSIARSVAVRRRALRAKLRHIGWGAIELAGGLLLVIAIAVAAFYWRLSQGDISLSFVTGPIETAINDSLPGYSVNIDDTVLERTGSDHGVSFRLKGLVLRAPNGAVIAAAPKAEIGISMRALLFGRVQPRRIELIGAKLALTYDARGRLRIGLDASKGEQETAVLTEPATAGGNFSLASADQTSPDKPGGEGQSFAAGVAMLRDILSGARGGNHALSALEEIGISETQAVLIHERMGRHWSMQNGTVRLSLRGDALHVDAGADVTYQGKPIPLRAQASLRNMEDGVSLTGTLSDVVPHDIALSLDAENLFTAIDMPVTASFSGEVSNDGTLRGGLMDVVVGAGTIRLLGEDRDGLFLDEAKLRVSYDAAQRLIELHPSEFYSGQSSAVLEGKIFAGPRDGPVPDTWRYDIRAKQAQLGSADLTADPMAVDSLSAQGSYDAVTGVLQLYRGEFVAGDVGAAASAIVSPTGDTPRIQIAGSVSPMNAQQLKDIWPAFIAAKARKWVLKNVVSGQITGATLMVDLNKDNIESLKERGPLESGALQMNFGIRDVETRFMDEMPTVKLASGSGRIVGTQFKLEAQQGFVELPSGQHVELKTGVLDVPRLDHKISDGFFDLALTGKANALLEMLDHKPLGLLSKWTLKPNAFGGDGNVALRLALPMEEGVALDQVEVEAEAELSGVTGRAVLADHGFSDGRILVNVKDRMVHVAGEGKIGSIPANLTWSIPFDSTGSANQAPNITMTLDDSSRAELGLSMRGVSGPVTVLLAPNLRNANGQTKLASFAADLGDATLDWPALGLFKAPGEEASLHGDVLSHDDEIEVKQLELTSKTFAALGDLKVNRKGVLQSLSLPMLRLSANDNLTVSAERNAKGRLGVKISGTNLDVARLMTKGPQQAVDEGEKSASDDDAGPIDLTVSILHVIGRHSAEIRDLSARATIEDGKIRYLDFNGDAGAGATISATIRTDENDRRRLRLVSSNAGAAFRFAGIYRRMEGGGLTLDAELPNGPDQSGQGLLKVDNFFVRGEPVIRRISDSTAAAANATEKIDSSRIKFDRLRMPFTLSTDRLVLSETVLRGPSVGGSIEGQIDLAADSIDLAGTYVPAYAVNNVLSHVPIFGRVLTGGEHGGLVGITFSVRGSMEEPVVTMNPVSAITPGVFRRIFEFAPTGNVSRDTNVESHPVPEAPIVTQ